VEAAEAVKGLANSGAGGPHSLGLSDGERAMLREVFNERGGIVFNFISAGIRDLLLTYPLNHEKLARNREVAMRQWLLFVVPIAVFGSDKCPDLKPDAVRRITAYMAKQLHVPQQAKLTMSEDEVLEGCYRRVTLFGVGF
jgi:hypothetical protein